MSGRSSDGEPIDERVIDELGVASVSSRMPGHIVRLTNFLDHRAIVGAHPRRRMADVLRNGLLSRLFPAPSHARGQNRDALPRLEMRQASASRDPVQPSFGPVGRSRRPRQAVPGSAPTAKVTDSASLAPPPRSREARWSNVTGTFGRVPREIHSLRLRYPLSSVTSSPRRNPCT